MSTTLLSTMRFDLRGLTCGALLACLSASPAHGQIGTDHVPGKVYVIRVSPLAADMDTLSRSFTQVLEQLNSVDGMLQRVKSNLYLMRSTRDERSFIGYFHADRQSKDALTEDFNLLTWLFHGHHVVIVPIEHVQSPARQLTTTADGKVVGLPTFP